ncbi:hypothetical protein DTO027B5_5087 [Paecilomyces variotii]|nr:hypothetical protein DTO169C6_5572 [Paecilomyces variotii]KAJ9284379.1 hypothetical protein DTO021C3_8024 [Paecilomyces variotii]KAJ9322594.1 hypothetical protein DTO027B3_6364 [Paecilomyces variotii]KAJ9333179.1 hypothetical protein DTO027B5_5087 [Paecilomyces variotii]KAJ9396119.1 hypothetical protein DTO282F9_6962 [Paecilomyces variotii]
MESHRKPMAHGLPKTPAEWRQKAAREVIQPPPRQNDGRRPVYAPSLHVGDKAIDVPLRHLSGWESASRVQLSHFLTTRTLVQMVESKKGIMGIVHNLTDFHLTAEISRKACDWLQEYRSWNAYLSDIEEHRHKAPPSGEAPELGEFGNARYHQLKARLLPEIRRDPEPAPPTLRDRDPNVSYNEESPTSDDPMQDIASSYVGSDSNTTGLLDLTRTFSGGSNFSTARPAEDEEIVNIGLVDFLVALTKCCRHVGLDWDGARANLDVDVGDAHIAARSDGRLHPTHHKDIYALLEVKPFRLAANPDKTLMQMAIQLLCWMIGENFSKDHPYIMISGHREHVYLTLATFGQGYPKYISEGVVDNQEDCFLKLTCYGPFNMYADYKVKFLGQLVLALGIMSSEAWKAKQASSPVGAQPTTST